MNIKFYISLFIISVIFSLPGYSQNYGNEWIDFTKNYYRISIPETGIYRITTADLNNANVPIGNFNPQNIQLFYKGEEIPCYIKGEGSGMIEYIEFYAEKNEGWFDVGMFDTPESQTNPYYSMITDTAAVFLTWNTSFNNKRFSLETDTDFAGYLPAEYCLYTEIQQFTNIYATSYNDCEYLEAEGWFDNQEINLTTSRTKNLATPGHVNSEENVHIDLAFITFSNFYHHIKVEGPGFVKDTIFNGSQGIKLSKSLTNIMLEETSSFTFSAIDDGMTNTDKSRVSYIKISYPRNFKFNTVGHIAFSIPPSPNTKTYIEISGFDASGEVFIYDKTRDFRIPALVDENTVKSLVPASGEQVDLYLYDDNYIEFEPEISKVDFINHADKQSDYLIISHPKLWNAAQEYATYRDAYMVDVEELYNQFGYGIQSHPLAIRNFLNYINTAWDSGPGFLFIIGKGVAHDEIRKSSVLTQQCLVPTMGYPPSDALLSTKISNNPFTPAIPTGRLAARTSSEVTDYLNKVKAFELQEPQEWMKQIIHFGGGKTAFEQSQFKKYLGFYENYITDTLFGGTVSTFLKTSSDPISISKTDSITNLVNNGVSLMTFFGHGSTNGFDQNIDEPDAYNNIDRYPLMLANSCYSGNIHLPGKASNSEDWVIAGNKGCIGFLAMVHQGFPNYLNLFSTRFYRNLSYNNYGQPVGVMINNAKRNLFESYPFNLTLKSTIQEFTLHGDPAIVLNSQPKPDFVINSSDIFFTPRVPTTEIDSFYVNIEITNIGKTYNKSFGINIQRVFQNGAILDTSLLADKLYYRDTFSLKLPIDRIKGQGNNQFYITIDPIDEVDELSNANNNASLSVFISSGAVTTIFPYNYSVVPESPAKLKAYTGNPLIKEQTTVFELDTTPTFNSPAALTQELVHSGGVVEWGPSTSFIENTVYFWRSALKETDKIPVWSQKSFSVTPEKTGWRQIHKGQFVENDLQWLEYSGAGEELNFSTTPKKLRCLNIGSPSGDFEYRQIGYSVDGIGSSSSCGTTGAMVIAVIDSLNLIPWKSDRDDYNHVNLNNCGLVNPQNYFVFHTDGDLQGVTNLVNFIDTVIPTGNYFLIYSFRNGNFQNYSAYQRAIFEENGADEIRFVGNNYPYILFARKGYPNETVEIIGETTDDIIEYNRDLQAASSYGAITTDKIGPALDWNSFYSTFGTPEINSDEEYFVRIFGVDYGDNKKLLRDSVSSGTIDISEINPLSYPYLKLQYFVKDEAYKTPVMLKEWGVDFTPVSDLAINPAKGWEFNSDTLLEGEMARVIVPVENLGGYEMDSVTVKYWLQDADNNEKPILSKKIKPLSSQEIYLDTVNFETIGLLGSNKFWAEINPRNGQTFLYDQPEYVHFNNIIQKPFFVKKDASNPLLDVTFDGVHIMDGDLVSAAPEIVMQLKDENPYLALDDTSVFSVYIKSHQTGIEKKIFLNNNPDITFVPAELPENKAQLIFSASFEEDGQYELRVQAKDPSGNESGSFDYLVSFQVINESTITNVFNYPNPFSTSTRFVFELTGAQIPDEMRIDILTVTGKVVKVIYLEDLGPLNIGRNITQYAWNGRDMYGDPLANGVYFYRVFARVNGEELKIRDTGTNQYFKNGFGKMYLMR